MTTSNSRFEPSAEDQAAIDRLRDSLKLPAGDRVRFEWGRDHVLDTGEPRVPMVRIVFQRDFPDNPPERRVYQFFVFLSRDFLHGSSHAASTTALLAAYLLHQWQSALDRAGLGLP